MNDLGLTLLGAAARVTLLALAAVPLYAAASRRGPRAAAAVATAGLAGCVALTVLAFCPLPNWWSWYAPSPARTPPRRPAAADEAPAPTAATPEPAAPAGAVSLAGATAVLRGLWSHAEESAPPRPAAPRWPAAVATAGLLGAGTGVLRLALGLWAVGRGRRRARPVHDGPLVRLAEELRTAMGCRRRVAVRETEDVRVPATAGWLRPLVLLPADWRTWCESDLRAVLAHELAHVSRSDYLTGLLARLGVALHFYHPLVRWLAGRLRLEQELAADALGARFAGGRGPYLRALARLALRQDGQAPPGPGRMFLSAGGTLERRIQMLRKKPAGPERAPSWPGRSGAVVLLVAAVTASGLRGPTPAAEAAPPAAPSQAPSAAVPQGTGVLVTVPALGPVPVALDFGFPVVTAEAAPFDLSAVPPGAKGVWAFRPAAFFARPGMKKYADAANKYLALLGKEALHLDPSLAPAVEDIEQAVGTVTLGPLPGDKGRSALMADLRLIRTRRDFDWQKLLAALFPKAAEVRTEYGSYYRVPGDGLAPALGGGPHSKGKPFICYQIADARTVVFGSEAEVRGRLSGAKAAPPQHAWAAVWRPVERGLFAAAYDSNDKAWLGARDKTDDAAEAAMRGIVERASGLACGLSAADDATLTLVVRCPTAEQAKQVRRLGADLLKEARAQLALARSTGDPTAADDELLVALTKADWKVQEGSPGEDCCLTWRCRAPMNLPALIASIVSGAGDHESNARDEKRP
jgi:hypothetical protein